MAEEAGNDLSKPSSSKENLHNSSDDKTKENTAGYALPVSTYTLLVNPRQRGNKVLSAIKEVPWEFSPIEPDYVMAQNVCALFLSLRYHNLYPDYIHQRIKSLGKSYGQRILLVQVDITEPNASLMELNMIAVWAGYSLILSWSEEESARCLESFKVFQNKSAESLMKRPEEDLYLQIIESLTTIKSVNKTDAENLMDTFGSLSNIASANVEELALCPGIGMLKAKRIHEEMHQSFLLN